MKLLLTLDFPPQKGGIQNYLAGIVRHAYESGDIVMVGCPPRLLRHTDRQSIIIHRYSFPFSGMYEKLSLISMLFAFAALLLHRKSNLIIECGNIYAALLPWFLSHFIKPLPYRVYTYGTEIIALKKPSAKTRLLRSALKKAQTIYALGEYTSSLLRNIGVSKSIEIVPPKITLPDRQHATSLGSNRFRILAVGRLVDHKGYDILLQAVARLPENCDWELILVGDGPQLGHLMNIAHSYHCKNRVEFKRRIPDHELTEEYRKAAAFVLPSRETPHGTEGFGIVLLEAMAYNVPIIASRTGGIVEVLDKGACGILTEPGNVFQLTEALAKLWSNNAYGKALAQTAYQHLSTHYAWK